MNPDFPAHAGDAIDMWTDRLGNLEFIDDQKWDSAYKPGFFGPSTWWKGVFFDCL